MIFVSEHLGAVLKQPLKTRLAMTALCQFLPSSNHRYAKAHRSGLCVRSSVYGIDKLLEVVSWDDTILPLAN